MLRVGILGPGGVGGLLAATLARQGVDVVCVARDATAQAIREHGISVKSARFGSFTVPVSAQSQLTGPVDVLCVTVKATALDAALSSVSREVLDDALVLPFLNGIEHVQVLRSTFAAATIVPAVIRTETLRSSAGVIEQLSPFARIDVAPEPGVASRLEPLLVALEATGFDVNRRGDADQMLWEKLSFIASMALLTTNYGVPVGVVRDQHRAELEAVLGEIAVVASTVGAVIDPATVLTLIDAVPATMRSSMQRDRAAGLPIELDAIGGAIRRAASAGGVDVPNVTKVVEALRSA